MRPYLYQYVQMCPKSQAVLLTLPINVARRNRDYTHTMVTCLFEDIFSSAPLCLLHPVCLDIKLSYERILWIPDWTVIFLQKWIRLFYTPPCKRCTDFTETYRYWASSRFVCSGSTRDDTGLFIRTNEPPLFCGRYEVDSSEPSGITGTPTRQVV